MKYKTLMAIFILLINTTSLLALENAKTITTKPAIDPLSGSNVFQMVAGLVLVLFLVIAVAWLVKRVGGVTMAGGGALSIVGGMSMGARERVVLIQVGDEQLLIGVSPGRIQKLHVLDKPIDIQTKKTTDVNFATRFSEALRGKSK